MSSHRLKANYYLRPNKNVERKLVFRALQRLDAEFRFGRYLYIGMGSMWFVDLMLAHRLLGVQRLVSIERSSLYERAVFNNPFQCIEVVEGETTTVLPGLLDGSRAIIWLDHEVGIKQEVFEDCRIVVEKAGAESVFLLTVNAHRGFLDEGRSDRGHAGRVERLRGVVGDLVSSDIGPDDLTTLGFPKLVGRLLLDALRHYLTAAGRSERFVPLFNFSYADAQPMVTVGGILAGEAALCRLDVSKLEGLDYLVLDDSQQEQIELPHLTSREKAALDQMLPCEGDFSEERVRRTLGFPLGDRELAAYRRFYLEYPVFGELML